MVIQQIAFAPGYQDQASRKTRNTHAARAGKSRLDRPGKTARPCLAARGAARESAKRWTKARRCRPGSRAARKSADCPGSGADQTGLDRAEAKLKPHSDWQARRLAASRGSRDPRNRAPGNPSALADQDAVAGEREEPVDSRREPVIVLVAILRSGGVDRSCLSR